MTQWRGENDPAVVPEEDIKAFLMHGNEELAREVKDLIFALGGNAGKHWRQARKMSNTIVAEIHNAPAVTYQSFSHARERSVGKGSEGLDLRSWRKRRKTLEAGKEDVQHDCRGNPQRSSCDGNREAIAQLSVARFSAGPDDHGRGGKALGLRQQLIRDLKPGLLVGSC